MNLVTKVSLEPEETCADIPRMAQVYFTNAPRDVTFVGGDPAALRKIQTVELGVWGDAGLRDRMNDSLLIRESGVYGFPVKEEVLKFGKRKLTA